MFMNKKATAVYGMYENTNSGYASAKKCYSQLVVKFGSKRVVLTTNEDHIIVGVFGDITY